MEMLGRGGAMRLRKYAQAGPVTLLTACRDLRHAHTAVLADLVDG
jgi:uncharacterized protein YeaO (DUF488 family)